jgi:pyruvate kinase
MIEKVRIVATLGPKTNSKSIINELVLAGVNIFRLNGSHNTLSWHEKTIKRIQKIVPNIPILMDIPGKKIRTLMLKNEPSFNIGDEIILTTDLNAGSGKVKVGYNRLHKDLSKGDVVLADDGTLKFYVKKIKNNDIYLIAETDGTLRSRKGINVPNIELNMPLVTNDDKEMVQFCKKNKVDFIGISFVESKEHVAKIKKLINPDTYPRIISKVENKKGLSNCEEIIEVSDGIMIDRGDLSVETELNNLTINQKEIIKSANNFSKPVIVATEVLHSMIKNNYPTKAEVSDISNAVLDGCSALMLSGETAIGKFPIEAVCQMRSIINATEKYIIHSLNNKVFSNKIGVAAAKAIALIAKETNITKVIAITRSGFAARMLSYQNIQSPIIAVSDDKESSKSFNIFPGVEGTYYPKKFPSKTLNHIPSILNYLWKVNKVKPADNVIVAAVAYPNSGNRMNLIETHTISDLIETLNWEK